jgi:hypothetical protein
VSPPPLAAPAGTTTRKMARNSRRPSAAKAPDLQNGFPAASATGTQFHRHGRRAILRPYGAPVV